MRDCGVGELIMLWFYHPVIPSTETNLLFEEKKKSFMLRPSFIIKVISDMEQAFLYLVVCQNRYLDSPEVVPPSLGVSTRDKGDALLEVLWTSS